MRKLLSILLATAMLIGVMTVAIPASASDVKTGASLESQYGANDMAETYYIYTVEDYVYFYNNIGNFWGSEIKLENDLDINPNWTARIIPPNGNDVTEYTVDTTGLTVKFETVDPVGKIQDAVIDGQGHTIRGIYVEGVAAKGASIFGHVYDTVVKNIRFENCATISRDASGNLAHRAGGIAILVNNETVFENVYADIKVVGTNDVGGFVALNYNTNTCDINYNNCVSNCEVVGMGTAVGGFIGNSWDRSASTFSNCGFFGSVTVGDTNNACGMFVGSTSAGTTANAAKANLNSRITLNNCIGAGTTNANTEINGALIGYAFFHSKATTDVNTGEVIGYTSNINSSNSTNKTQYINIALTNCIYVGNYADAIGANQDKAQVLANKDTIGVDAQYNYTPTAVAKVEANTLTGVGAVLAVTGQFDLTEYWVAVADSFPLPKTMIAPVTDGDAGDAGDAGNAGGAGNSGNNDTTNSGNANTSDTTTTAAPETTAPAEENKGCGSSIGLAGIALVATAAVVVAASKKRED